jgi:hypothetical protein
VVTAAVLAGKRPGPGEDGARARDSGAQGGTEAGFAPRWHYTQESLQSFPPQPASWVHSDLEWACYWVLTARMKLRLWEDFSYQRRIPAAGLNKVSADFRADFWIFAHGRGGGGGGYRYPMGVILDPLSFFTHKSKGLDILKRQILATNGFLCIFLGRPVPRGRALRAAGGPGCRPE